MRKRDLITAAAGALVATMLAGGIAWAAIPGPGAVYTACMLKNVGTVRLIDKALPPNNLMSRCSPTLEVEVSWNQAGQQGIQGIQGPPGTNGTNGTNGTDGDDGAPGPAGERGPQGEQGVQGTQGAQGPQGERGLQGEQGLQGTQGPKGDKGDACLASDPACVGPKGDKGDRGDAGAQGPQGLPGVGGFQIVQLEEQVPANTSELTGISCPAGKVPLQGATRGGGSTEFAFADIGFESYFLGPTGFYEVVIHNTHPETRTYVVRLSCASVQP